MLTQITAFVFVISFLAYASDVVATQHGRKLTGNEIRTLTADSTSYGVSKDGYEFIVYRAPDGNVRGYAGRSYNPRQLYDEGEWYISDDRYCVQFNEWRRRERRCFFIYHLEGDHYEGEFVGGHDYVPGTSGKSAWSELRIVPGNPSDL